MFTTFLNTDGTRFSVYRLAAMFQIPTMGFGEIFLMFTIASLALPVLCLAENPNYTIAIVNELGNSMEVDIQQTGPAFELGIQEIQRMVGHRINLTIMKRYMQQDHLVCTDIKYGSTVAELHYIHNVDGIIGPGELDYFILYVFSCWCISLTPLVSLSHTILILLLLMSITFGLKISYHLTLKITDDI